MGVFSKDGVGRVTTSTRSGVSSHCCFLKTIIETSWWYSGQDSMLPMPRSGGTKMPHVRLKNTKKIAIIGMIF